MMSTSILVVEDDPMFAKAVGRDLVEQGFAVTIVHSVSDALPILALEPIGGLLSDLRLGAQDGIDLLDALRKDAPRRRAVLMSGFATARDYQRAVELGAVRVLCKPFTPTELLQCIHQAIECETGFRGSVHGLSLVDMLQMFNYGRRSVTVNVAGQNPGRLCLRDGQIIHVEHQGLDGEAALRSLLAMPTGSLSTSALVDTTTQSVTRDFREVLLDALRAMDEASAGGDEPDLDHLLDEPEADEPAVAAAPASAVSAQVIERVRAIDGYIAACLVQSESGGVLGYDGELDLRPAAAPTAEALRLKQQSIIAMGLDDAAEDILITSTHQYHLLRFSHSGEPTFVYLVLDRSQANPALAKLALASAVRAVDL